MIVVDTNIIAYLFISGEFSEQAEKVLLKDPQWAAPLLWRSELRSVLTQYIRKELLSLADAVDIMDHASRLMENNEYDVNSRLVLALAKESNLSAYDCEFIALAKDLGVKLVTADQKIAEIFSEYTIFLQGFTGEA
jgi:predicted nucleic acid-binding protein